MKFARQLALGIFGLMAAVSASADAPPAVTCYQSAVAAISSTYGDSADVNQVVISQKAVQLCAGAQSDAPVACYKAALESISSSYGDSADNNQVAIGDQAIRLCSASANESL